MRALKQVLPAAAILLAVAPWAAGQVGARRPTPMRGARSAGKASLAAAAAGPLTNSRWRLQEIWSNQAGPAACRERAARRAEC